MNLRSQKGINMITLSIAIVILVIITTMLVYNSKDGVKVSNLNNLYNDIETLNNKISAYYVKHGDIPKLAKYENLSFLSLAETQDNENKIGSKKQINPNNGNDFYVINLKALEGVSLNYGRDYDNVADSNDPVVAYDDIYIINGVSHTIYYPRGIEVQDIHYYTEPDNWTSVDLSAIPIYTAEQMSWVGDGQQHAVNGVAYTFSLDGSYILKNDIDLSSVCHKVDGTTSNDVSWTPIGTERTPFTGCFYGSGHTIDNIYINSAENNQGLFGSNSGKIQDLTIKGQITGVRWVAGVVGINLEDASIINCKNYANIEATNTTATKQGGGIAGSSYGYIHNCYNYGNVVSNTTLVSGGAQIGGICGFSMTGIVEECYNYGSISDASASTSGNSYCGGIVGNLGNASNKATVKNCYNYGKISGKSMVGGISRKY